MEKRPNILLFVADQMRCDSLAHMGNPASKTPNLDSVLEDGVSFANAYCQNPVCVPSRCSFLTGRYPHTTGHRTMHFLQEPQEPNILRTMKDQGYEVIWVGRNDIIPGNRAKTPYCDEFYSGADFVNHRDDENLKFAFGKSPSMEMPEFMKKDHYYSFYTGKMDSEDAKSTFDWNCIQSALDYLDRKKAQGDDRPFFLYITLSFPHPPYGCEEPWFSSIARDSLPPRRTDVEKLPGKPSMLQGIRSKQNLNNWTEDQYNELRAVYLGMVERFDHQFGMVRDRLKQHGFYDDTSIFVFSDHGDYTGDYGITEKVQNCFENPISNVPLLVKPASKFPVKPGKSEALVELLDLPATFADMAGFSLDYTQFGKSLLEAVAGAPDHKDAVFCEGGRIHGETQAMERGHGPESPYWPRLSTQCTEGPEHTKAAMIRMGQYKYVMRLYEQDEFYDLEKDPMELSNAIESPEYEGQIQTMRMRLLEYYMETADTVPNRRDPR
ncbi:MAG: sulfatase-like hydrolase/transferase [Hungatella sp.]|nr:sulfatase-like hydrolase/transferase [Hungatella sp.]